MKHQDLMKMYARSINENYDPTTSLLVKPNTEDDKAKLEEYLNDEGSDFYGEWSEKEKAFVFEEEFLAELENVLKEIFEELDINATFDWSVGDEDYEDYLTEADKEEETEEEPEEEPEETTEEEEETEETTEEEELELDEPLDDPFDEPSAPQLIDDLIQRAEALKNVLNRL
jgi:hypothetical protein